MTFFKLRYISIVTLTSIIIFFSDFSCKNISNQKLYNINKLENKHLKLTFLLEYEETSKDCSSQRTEISISEKILTFKNQNFERDFDEKNEFTVEIDSLIEKEIEKFFIENDFFSDVNEIKNKKGIGISGLLMLEYDYSKKIKINIEGKKNIWGSDDYVIKEWGEKYIENRTNIDNIKYFEKAESFINFIIKYQH